MNDRDIIDLYWRRSERAIVETAQKYGGYCHGIAYRILENTEDSEECVNDTWLSAWNAMPDQRPERLGAFLAKITRNFALTRIVRRTARKRGGGETALALEELDECIASGYSLEREIEERELSQAIDRFLERLSEQDRRLFIGRYWFMLSEKELAKQLGRSRSWVNARLRRVREKLKHDLVQEGLCTIRNV